MHNITNSFLIEQIRLPNHWQAPQTTENFLNYYWKLSLKVGISVCQKLPYLYESKKYVFPKCANSENYVCDLFKNPLQGKNVLEFLKKDTPISPTGQSVDLFAFSKTYMIKKVLFFNQIFEVGFLMELYALRSPESKNYVFNGSSVSACVCQSVISSSQNIKIPESPISVI